MNAATLARILWSRRFKMHIICTWTNFFNCHDLRREDNVDQSLLTVMVLRSCTVHYRRTRRTRRYVLRPSYVSLNGLNARETQSVRISALPVRIEMPSTENIGVDG